MSNIPSPAGTRSISPECLLTPAIFALDGRIRFPLINRSFAVRNILRSLDVLREPLVNQYLRMVGVYGYGGISDAVELDQAGLDPDFATLPLTPDCRIPLKKKSLFGKDLKLKDEGDLDILHQAKRIVGKRVHNELTNRLKKTLTTYDLYEGDDRRVQFDVIVRGLRGNEELLIEVKSSIELPHVRMAIGQLYSYRFSLGSSESMHLAVLLPERPYRSVIDLLESLKIGLLWFDDDGLCTSTKRLRALARLDDGDMKRGRHGRVKLNAIDI